MECPKCGLKLRREAKFCDQCGTKVIKPEEVIDLSPILLKLLEGLGTGLKFLGGTIQEWAGSSREKKKDE